MTEAANPAQPEAVNVSDVPSASAAIEGLLEPTPQEEGQPEAANDAPERAEVQVEATPENEPEVEAEADVEHRGRRRGRGIYGRGHTTRR